MNRFALLFLISLLAVMWGCSAPSLYERKVEEAEAKRRLLELEVEIQSLDFQACKDLTAHSIRCHVCQRAKDWHAKKWGRKTKP